MSALFQDPYEKLPHLPPDPTNGMTSVCTTTPHRPHKIKNQAHTLIISMRSYHRPVHPKFQPYLDRFICDSVTNSLRCSTAERDLEIIHREAIVRAACKKLKGRVAQMKGSLQSEMCAERSQNE